MQSIFHAIHKNDLSSFMSLVEERESLLEERTKEDGLNNTVLHVAAKLGHIELVSKIIELRPSLVCSRNEFENTPLHLAAALGDVSIVAQILETGLEVCSARNYCKDTPLNLACRSNAIEAAKLIAEKSLSFDLGELICAVSNGSTGIAKIILERFPDLARVGTENGSQSTLLHHACEKGDVELTSILLRLDQELEEAVNTKGLTPLHLAVVRGSVEILKEFLDKVPLSFSSLTPSKETVFHLAARNKHMDAFIFMAENLGINSQILLQQTDENDNTVLHVAASVACDISFIRYIVDDKIVDIKYKNKMGLEAFQLLPREAQDFELLSRLLRFGTQTSEQLDSGNKLKHEGKSNPLDENLKHEGQSDPLDILSQALSRGRHRHQDNKVNMEKLRHSTELKTLLWDIKNNTSDIAERAERAEIAEQKRGKEERGRHSFEYEMQIEALQNARNMIAIVAVLIASVAYAGGINPPGGVHQDGPWRGKSVMGKTKAFKVFAICNNIALFTSLCIVVILVSIIPYKRKLLKKLLVVTHRMMWVSVLFMATAFIAASWLVIPHYNGTRWLFPAIIVVAGGTLMLVFLYLGVETILHWFKKKNREGEIPSFARTSSDIAASEGSGYFTV